LKTVYFTETIVSGYFLAWSSAICVFFAALYLTQDVGGEVFCNDGGGDPLQALLEGALGQQATCQPTSNLPALISLWGRDTANNGAGMTFWCLFPLPIIANSCGDGSLGDSLAKNKFCGDMLGLLSPKTTNLS
jgi:hypothetical protein